jgi:hypothetical protein
MIKAIPGTYPNDEFVTTGVISNVNMLIKYTGPGARLENETELLTKQDITVYPNPATSNFNLNGVLENTSVTIYDMSGRMVLRTNYQPGESIDVTGWNKGLYLLNIETVEGMMSRKVLVD